MHCDKVHEECGVFGIYDKERVCDAARMTYYALFSLQHRGHDSAGIAVTKNRDVYYHKDNGAVSDVFKNGDIERLKDGEMAMGHVRYGKIKMKTRENVQPLIYSYLKGSLTIAINGSITNYKELCKELEQSGAIFQTRNSAAVIAHLIARERANTDSIEQSIVNILPKLQGAYSILVMSPAKLIACRDPYGIKPLSIGKNGSAVVFSSETCALDAVNAEFERDVEPGEVVVVGEHGIRSIKTHCGRKPNMCIFEYIYFARPDSIIGGQDVYEARREAGRLLAQEHKIDADVVVGVPDSGLIAAAGYAEFSKIPLATGIIKNKYTGRTFITETQREREELVRNKLNTVKSVINGKRVILIDDSIVRGTTCLRLVKLIRDAGAAEIHMLLSSPPFLYPCYYGVDIPSVDDLVATGKTLEEMRQYVGVDYLGYLSLENTKNIAKCADGGFCMACFDRNYPTEIGGY